MSEVKGNKRKTTGNHYSEFSKDEFKGQYTIKRLCNAIKADNYGLKFHKSSDNSIGRLNEILESTGSFDVDDLFSLKSYDLKDIINISTGFFKEVLKKKNINCSFDLIYLHIRTGGGGGKDCKLFSELDPKKQILVKRFNRLLLEEAYPKETPKSSKYFIPPGLMGAVDTFEDHYKIANGAPILIVGQTGVGKSLFLHIFEKLYREEHEDEIAYPVVKVNCAHFGGDPNLVRSELFGHMEGAFTGASFEKIGLVEKANGGVLVLEEIGDLPLETQAMILTFIETGEYYRVGDDGRKKHKSSKKENQSKYQSQKLTGTEESYTVKMSKNADQDTKRHIGPRKANVQIVGLTNRKENMREDLKYRFFQFYVPPIHKRREDILYYLHAMFPDIFSLMKPYEILTLLTYNWPGNVREIERVGQLLCRKNESIKRMTEINTSERTRMESYRLYNLDPDNSDVSVDVRQVQHLRNDLIKNNVDVEYLEFLIKPYNIGLKESNANKYSFEFGHYVEQIADKSIRYGLRYTFFFWPFFDAHCGLKHFCKLFYQDVRDDSNLLHVNQQSVFFEPDDISTDRVDTYGKLTIPKEAKNSFQVLINSIFEYLSGIKLNGINIILDDPNARQELFTKLGELHPENHFLASLGFTKLKQKKKRKDFDISSLSYNELLASYYQKLYDRAGNYEKAAKIAGMSATNFGEMYNKYVKKKVRKRNMSLKTS
ncbi:MAG: sigma 54-interacting transcriptional regulator [Desulfobacterales bacterium]